MQIDIFYIKHCQYVDNLLQEKFQNSRQIENLFFFYTYLKETDFFYYTAKFV